MKTYKDAYLDHNGVSLQVNPPIIDMYIYDGTPAVLMLEAWLFCKWK